MFLGRQFEQMELFPKPPEKAASEARNERVPVGGQYEIPYKEDLAPTPKPPETTGPTRQERLLRDEHPVDVYHGGTYPMMMTGPEIRHQFQALDGDRDPGNEYYDDGGSRSNAVTVEGSRISPYGYKYRANTTEITAGGGENKYATTRKHFSAGDRIPRVRKRYSDLPETDDDLYDRKLSEADESATHNEYGDTRPSGSDFVPHGAGLTDQILNEGYDLKHPVSLSTGQGRDRDRSWTNTAGRGAFGKYQVLGGHHRVAVMSTHKPNSMLSVQWAGSIDEAKNSKSY